MKSRSLIPAFLIVAGLVAPLVSSADPTGAPAPTVKVDGATAEAIVASWSQLQSQEKPDKLSLSNFDVYVNPGETGGYAVAYIPHTTPPIIGGGYYCIVDQASKVKSCARLQ